MKVDIEWVKNEFCDICEKAGLNRPTQFPVYINSRLRTTLGRLKYYSANGKLYPLRVEFSKSMIENNSENAVRAIVMHEAAHYIAWRRTQERHGHDHYFKEICKEIGCKNDKTKVNLEDFN